MRALAAELPRVADENALAALEPRVLPVPGVRSSTLARGGSWSHQIEIDPMDAEQFASILGLRNVYIMSPDVHQHGWIMISGTRPFVDDYGHRRVVAESFRYGAWEIVPRIDQRPRGPLPGISAGPSPAYPLARSGAKVTAIEIRLAQD